jgi:septum formation protein
LLSLIGIAHTVRPADIDESVQLGETPLACVQRLARTKAERIARAEHGTGDAPLIIAADTIVVIDDCVLNKPRDEDDARDMLGRLQGRVHDVHTGVSVTWRQRWATGVESVCVRFRPLSAVEIDTYIATGEPMDKAGAYGIQGYGATIVDRIEGDFFSVMGLPLVRLVKLMREVGVAYHFGELNVLAGGVPPTIGSRSWGPSR